MVDSSDGLWVVPQCRLHQPTDRRMHCYADMRVGTSRRSSHRPCWVPVRQIYGFAITQVIDLRFERLHRGRSI
jgi:hypothetical protein